jgi:hypothetical protein
MTDRPRITRADLLEAGWLPPGQLEREIRRRLLGGEPVCGLNRPQALRIARTLRQAGLSYPAISTVMTIIFGPACHASGHAWRKRLSGMVAPRPRGVPFPAQTTRTTQ